MPGPGSVGRGRTTCEPFRGCGADNFILFFYTSCILVIFYTLKVFRAMYITRKCYWSCFFLCLSSLIFADWKTGMTLSSQYSFNCLVLTHCTRGRQKTIDSMLSRFPLFNIRDIGCMMRTRKLRIRAASVVYAVEAYKRTVLISCSEL